MTLPASGPLFLSQIADELVISASGLSLNHAWVRALAQKPGGAISYADLRGRTGKINTSYATNPSSPATNPIILFGYPDLFGGNLYELSALQTGGGSTMSLTLTFQGAVDGLPVREPPVYAGNFRVTNQSTGHTYVLPKIGTAFWGGTFGWDPNIVRIGATADVFLIQPA